MKSAVEQINDLVLLQQHENEKYKNYLIGIALADFNILMSNIRDIIKSGYDPENTTQKAQKALQKKIDEKLQKGLEAIQKKIDKELKEFTGQSATSYESQLKDVFDPVNKWVKIKKINKTKLKEKYDSDKMALGETATHTVAGMWRTFEDSITNVLTQATDQAYLLDKDTLDYESSLFGSGGATETSKNHLSSTIATLTAFGYNSALKYVNYANRDYLPGYVWQSVMDSKTSDICIFLNEKYWVYGRPEDSTLPYQIFPPSHHNCRSDTYPIVKTYEELGINPDLLTEGQKVLLSGTTPENFSYAQFIEDQPVRIQKEILGSIRYSMYVAGEITVDKFYTKDGRLLTLSELQKKGYEIQEEYIQYIRK
jgi:hypothetical protein